MWTIISFFQNHTLTPHELNIWWRVREPQPRVLSLPLLAWNHHLRSWGKSDHARAQYLLNMSYPQQTLSSTNGGWGNRSFHLPTSLTLDLASAQVFEGKMRKLTYDSSLEESPPSGCCKEKELCVLGCSCLEQSLTKLGGQGGAVLVQIPD